MRNSAILFTVLLGLALFACDDDDASNNTSNTNNVNNVNNYAGFLVEQYDVTSGAGITVDFSDPDSEYLLIPWSYGTTGQTISYSLDFPADFNPSAKKSLPLSINYDRIIRFERDHEMRLRDRALWKTARDRLKAPKALSPSKAGVCSTSADCASDELCEAGTCEATIPLYFYGWTIDTTITASVLAKGQHCALLLDDDDAGTSLDLTQTQIDDFLDSCDNVIVPRDRAFFGDPADIPQSPVADASDENGDGLIHVLFSSRVNQEEVWGFFASGDFYEDSVDYPSNERDIIYVALPESDEEITTIKSTMVHEYQHLLHFVIHNYIPALNGEDPDYNPTWLDEAFAHLSEEIAGYGIDNVSLVHDLLAVFSSVSLAFGADDLTDRAFGMLLALYLFEQHGGFDYGTDDAIVDLGGPSFLQAVIASASSGFDALDEAADWPMEDLFFDWLITLAVDNRGLTSSPYYTYNDIYTDPVTGNEIGVITNGTRVDSYGDSYTFTGPARTAITQNPAQSDVTDTSARFHPLSGYTGDMDVTITHSGSNLGLGVLRIPAQ